MGWFIYLLPVSCPLFKDVKIGLSKSCLMLTKGATRAKVLAAEVLGSRNSAVQKVCGVLGGLLYKHVSVMFYAKGRESNAR